MSYKDPIKLLAYKERHREDNIKRCREYRVKLRLEVLDHYSNGILECDCCKEKHIEFLSLDHKNGGGEKHRKLVGVGIKFYLWIKKNNYPEGYRVLCHNCNQSYGFYGYCPHKRV
jgi:hypothetical protein